MFALVDVNRFYCSAEQVFRPDWRGKPLIVLSNNDGIVVALNREAQALGIKKFSPYFKIRAQCAALGVIICSSNYELYGDLSKKMMAVIRRFAPEQYVYSIDESFLSFAGMSCNVDYMALATRLRKAVWKECRLSVSIGIGSTLTLAKAANYVAKKHADHHGIFIIDSEQTRQQLLQKMPVEELWGIGRRLAFKLKQQGVHSALQLAKQSPKGMRRDYSVEMERTILELNGQVCKRWDNDKPMQRQIFSTRVFGQRVTNKAQLQQALCQHLCMAAVKLRKQHAVCSVISFFVTTSPFDAAPIKIERQVRLAAATDDSMQLIRVLTGQIDSLFIENTAYYRVGVGLLELTAKAYLQPDLFQTQQTKPQLMQVMDEINQRYGTDTVFFAGQGVQPKWKMRRDYLTPQYTTCWQDLPVIYCHR